jgi:predicted TIM-barrel fold metal-dependent hydrolase
MTTTSPAERVIAVEEHFMQEALSRHLGHIVADQSPAIRDRLFDFFGIRIAEMDAAGIDMQVLSHQSPGSQRLPADVAVEACRGVNDALAEVIAQAPGRFSGLAMLPTVAPEAAADELQRAVEERGLKGALFHGLSHGRFLDAPEFRPIFARAEKLKVPLYLHPALPDKTVTERYYAPYGQSHPAFVRSGWGFGVETGTHAIRLILSGLFDEHPDLQVVLGHLGEGIPFFLARIDESLSRRGNAPVRFEEVFRNNFHVTTSGFLSDAALRCCIEQMGIERILFAVDWPYVGNNDATDWIRAFDLDAEAKRAILSGNAIRLFRL